MTVRTRKPELHQQEFIGPWCVSTVELRIEHHGGMWFETYIFEADGEKITNWIESWGIRYRTAAEATRGHDRIRALVKAGTSLEDLDDALEAQNQDRSQS